MFDLEKQPDIPDPLAGCGPCQRHSRPRRLAWPSICWANGRSSCAGRTAWSAPFTTCAATGARGWWMGRQGHCRGAIVCPFHGWVYNLDGTLRGAAQPDSFGDMDRDKFGLKPIEMQILHGFMFLRFRPARSPLWPTCLRPMPPISRPIGWTKLCRSPPRAGAPICRSTGNRSAMSTTKAIMSPWPIPACRTFMAAVTRLLPGRRPVLSNGHFGDRPGRRWSVRNYNSLAPAQDWLPAHLQRAWIYYGLFPNTVFAFTPEARAVLSGHPVLARPDPRHRAAIPPPE